MLKEFEFEQPVVKFGPATGSLTVSNKKLLAVTDDLILLNYLESILRDQYNITLSPSGLEALSHLGQESFDLICTDVTLTDFKVLELMETTRLLNPQCEILLLAGIGDMDLAFKAMEKGAFSFVPKPINPELLHLRLKQALSYIQSQTSNSETMAELKKQLAMKTAFSRQSDAMSSMATSLVQGLDGPITNLVKTFHSLMEIVQKSNSEVREEAGNLLTGFNDQIKVAQQVITQMGRFGSADAEVRAGDHNLRNLSEQAVKLALGRFRDTGIVITSQIPANLNVIVDPNHFNQVVLNLITNAAHAMLDKRNLKKGNKLINLIGFFENDSIIMEISDSGPGIPPDVAARIFEPYFTTKKATGGSGLGLHISRLLLQNYGARVSLHHTSEDGTSFRLSFPRS